ncbi:MAG TPA: hypothetical protein VF133_16495 [Terriglobales bacterium]
MRHSKRILAYPDANFLAKEQLREREVEFYPSLGHAFADPQTIRDLQIAKDSQIGFPPRRN